jgi:glycosyltransferase involved in cell wall biosynthesis
MRFTVFTPTYNRKATIGRVFESLQKQTLSDFEWLIVDDGSTDGTSELVEGWVNDPEVDFPIRYVWQENAHKKVAHNRAVKEANGELLLVFDSDDRCVPEALQRFWHHWQAIPDQEREQFAGVCGLCMDEAGRVVGERFPAKNYIDSDSLEIRYRYRVSGEKWGVMRTDVLRAHPFREDIPGLVPEGTVWDAIARRYKTRFFNEALRIYSQDVPGLIARKGEKVDPGKSAPGAAYAKRFYLENNIAYLRYAPREFILEAARLTRFWLHCPKEIQKHIGYWPKSGIGKALTVMGSPLGLGMFLVDQWRRNRHGARKGAA